MKLKNICKAKDTIH
jgi:hypothetical protein